MEAPVVPPGYTTVTDDTGRLSFAVDPTWIGRLVDASADLQHVRFRLDGRLITEHPRVWARGVTITDPHHVRIAKSLREAFLHPRSRPAEQEALVRDLADYDRAFGLTGEGLA